MEGDLDKTFLVNHLIEKIEENQALNGVAGVAINLLTRPIGELASFDSLTAMEVLVSLETVIEAKTGKSCELDVSLFFTDKGRKALSDKALAHKSLTVEEIVDNIIIALK